MARKSGSSNTAKKKEVKKKYCSTCEQEKELNKFYISYNPLHKDGHTPMCKECVCNACYDEETDEIDLEKLKSVLRQLDKPFITKMWNAAVKQVGNSKMKKSTIGIYFKNINTLQQVRSLNWEQGLEYDNKDRNSTSSQLIAESSRRKSMYDDVYYLHEDFKVTEDMIHLFGEGYTAKEYETMQRIYNDSVQDYPNISSNQKNMLLKYVRLAAKEEIAVSSGCIQDAEKWSKMASEALKQLNSIDIQGGVTCFSEFFQQFEREKDVTRILPEFKYRPNDAVDFIILCYVNYCRRLEGKPEVEYSDIYKFYDEKVAEYVKQYGDLGIFKDDTTLKNREKIKEFITMPPEYYEDGD